MGEMTPEKSTRSKKKRGRSEDSGISGTEKISKRAKRE